MYKIFRTHVFTPLAALLLLLPGAAIASNDGLFISGAVGYTQVDEDLDIDGLDDIEALFDDKSYGINLGVGWRFNSWLAVDAGYWDLGEFKSDRFEGVDDKVELEYSAITVGGIVSVPLWILDVYGRAGIAFWESDADFNLDDDGEDFYAGVGAALNVFSSIDLYLEYVYFDLQTQVDTVNLGVRLTF